MPNQLQELGLQLKMVIGEVGKVRYFSKKEAMDVEHSSVLKENREEKMIQPATV